MPATLSNLDSVFAKLLSSALALVGVASLVMLVIGGFQYLLASGNKEGASRAKMTLTYALGGLIVAVSAWMILSLFGNFFGIDVSTFTICVTTGCV